MADKERVLQHLHEIKSVLVDKDTFFPYNYNALIIWGVIGTIMTFVMPALMKSSVMQGTIFSLVFMSIGFVVEGFLTKRVNEDYDIVSSTKKQRFITGTFVILTLFAILISALLAKYDLIIPLFMLWMFLCGFGYYVVGYLLNIRLFTLLGYLSMAPSMVLFIISYFADGLGSTDSLFFYFAQGVSFAVLGLLPIWRGKRLKEEL